MNLNRISQSFILFIIIFNFNILAQENYVEQIKENEYKLPIQFIKAGNFTMGSPKSEKVRFGDEGPQHKFFVDGFWMGKFEITWDLYNLFVSRELDGYQVMKGRNSYE